MRIFGSIVRFINKSNMQSQQEQSSLPTLLFLLEHNKFSQLLKSMLNQTVSQNLLAQYQGSPLHKSGSEEFKAIRAAGRFTIRQLIELKGSQPGRARDYCNMGLRHLIRRKLELELPTAQTRKIMWVQFTELYSCPQLFAILKQVELAPEFKANIQKDITRTFKSPAVVSATQQVLHMLAQYNPYIGYCQGMNSIIAFLIDEGFSQEESFFIFKYATEQLLPCEYYTSMDSIMAYMRIFYELLGQTHPPLHTRLKLIAQEMDNSFVAMVSFVLQWFVCLFCNEGVHVEITRVVWDQFLLEGVPALFKAGLAYFGELEQHILQCWSYEAYNQMQRKWIKEVKDPHKFRRAMLGSYINEHILFLMKEKLTAKGPPTQQIKKVAQSARSKKKCNKNWNVCFDVLDQNFQNHKSYDFFVFRPEHEITIIPEYLDKLSVQYFNKQRHGTRLGDLRIGRIEHICESTSQMVTQDSISEHNLSVNMKKRKQYAQSLEDPHNNLRVDQSVLRKKAAEKIQEVISKKSMQKSESIVFMQNMVKNVSISNLLELYDIDEMFQ